MAILPDHSFFSMKYISAFMLALLIGSFAAASTAAAARTSTTDVRVHALASSTGVVPTVGDPAAFVPSVVSKLPTTTPNLSHLQAQIFGIASSGISGKLNTSAIGPTIKCNILAPIGWPIPAFSSECPASTTPPVVPPTRGLLTIIKNTAGGNGSFGFTITGPNPGTTTIVTSGGSGSVNLILDPGATTIVENVVAGWTQTNSGCTLGGNSTGSASGTMGWQLSLAAGAHVTCTFTNATTTGGGGNASSTLGRLVVIKQVSGGTASSSAFNIYVMNSTTTASSTNVAGSPQPGTATGTVYTLLAGQYVVSETGSTTGYSMAFSGDCNASGVVTVTGGATSTCSVTNTFDSGIGGGGDSSSPSDSNGSGGSSHRSSSGSNNSGEVLAAETTGVGGGGDVPGAPDTGQGGQASTTLATLIASLIVMLAGGASWYALAKREFRAI